MYQWQYFDQSFNELMFRTLSNERCRRSNKLPKSIFAYFQGPVPVEELENGHELLKLQHGFALVGLQHEAEGADARVGVVGDLLTAL